MAVASWPCGLGVHSRPVLAPWSNHPALERRCYCHCQLNQQTRVGGTSLLTTWQTWAVRSAPVAPGSSRLRPCHAQAGGHEPKDGPADQPQQAADNPLLGNSHDDTSTAGTAAAAESRPSDADTTLHGVPVEMPSISTEAPAATQTPALNSNNDGTSATSASPSSSSSNAATSQLRDQQDSAVTAGSQEPPYQAMLAWLAAVWAVTWGALKSAIEYIRQIPALVQQQQLKQLRDASDEDPTNADKHAAYLQLLNKVSPKQVLARVESREYNSNAAVVSEYLRALVLTGRINEYTAGSALPQGSIEDHKSMSHLLKDLQIQVSGDHADEAPGSSQRKPLHVTLLGAPLIQGMQRRAGPLQVVWGLLRTLLLIVFLSFAWLAGSSAVRRVQVTQVVAPTAASATSSSSAAAGGGPSVDPKEYKREELPEKAIRTFKDVRGCDEAKAELQEVVEFLKDPTRFTRLGAKLPKGVLLTGPPGTGKTLLARAVAGEAGVPFFYRAGSEFEELYVGVGSRRMRALFQAAKKKAPCIVFIDEIDAIGGNRKHWENHTRKTLNQLLVEMDGFEANEGVIVMAATNLADTLDPALKRPGRFDRQVAVPLPDLRGRQELLEYYLNDKPVDAAVDKDLLARQTQGFSGADISNLVNEAALLAAKQGADSITPYMLDHSFDKIRMGVERKSVRRTADSIKRTAYHEAGHALVAIATPGASPVHKATIVPRGHALGMVTQVGREDEFSINREQMLARIWVCMGGQVAEELIFGKNQVTSGATDDLRQATEWARYMVAECGLNEEVGPVHISESAMRHGLLSEQLKQRIDEQVRVLLVEAREGVKVLLHDRLSDLHRLAGALIEQETLTAEQITAVLAGDSAPGASAGGVGSDGSSAPPGDQGGGDRDLEPQLQASSNLADALYGDRT